METSQVVIDFLTFVITNVNRNIYEWKDENKKLGKVMTQVDKECIIKNWLKRGLKEYIFDFPKTTNGYKPDTPSILLNLNVEHSYSDANAMLIKLQFNAKYMSYDKEANYLNYHIRQLNFNDLRFSAIDRIDFSFIENRKYTVKPF